jgi:hypothetical protein
VRSTFRIRPELALAVSLAALALIGWVARTTLAQNSPPKPAEVPSLPAPADGDVTAGPVAPGPVLDSAPAAPSRTPFELDQPTPTPPPGAGDDPEKTVQAFVEQNRKVAETQLKNLRDEAEKLRARLQKVELGIRRWETLLTALQNSEAAPDRGELQPMPQARPQFNARAVPPPVAPRGETPSPRPDPGSVKVAPDRDIEPPTAPR